MKKLKKTIIILLIITAIGAGGGYWWYKKNHQPANSPHYLTAKVERGMLITSVTGSGQVIASNQVDIKPKVSGEISAVKIQDKQTVKEGEVIAQIDSSAAIRQFNAAKTALETAKLDLANLLAPVDSYTLLQAENDLANAKDALTKLKLDQANELQTATDNKQTATSDLEKTYEESYNNIVDAFLDLPNVMAGLYNILFGHEISDSIKSFSQTYTNKEALINSFLPTDYQQQDEFIRSANQAENDYTTAKTAYDQNLTDYKNTSRYADTTQIEELLDETYQTTKKIAEAIKGQANMLDLWVEYRTETRQSIYAKATQYQTNLNAYTSQTNSDLSSLLTNQNAIDNDKKSITDTEKDLADLSKNQPCL